MAGCFEEKSSCSEHKMCTSNRSPYRAVILLDNGDVLHIFNNVAYCKNEKCFCGISIGQLYL